MRLRLSMHVFMHTLTKPIGHTTYAPTKPTPRMNAYAAKTSDEECDSSVLDFGERTGRWSV